MSRVLVTGGAGFIGSTLVDRLVERGNRVVIVDDFSSGKRENLSGSAREAMLIEDDVRNLADLADAIGPVDRIFHLAALISGYDSLEDPDGYQRVNMDGLQRVIDFAGTNGVERIVFASSSTVYGNQPEPVLDEDRVPSPLSVYALTKLAGEHLLRLYAGIHGYSHCSLRLFNVYGPRQATDHPYANVTCKFSHAAANRLPVDLYGDGQQARDFVFVEDVVAAFLAVSDRSSREIYNVGTGQATSITQLLDELAGIAGERLIAQRKPPWPNDIRTIRADVARFEGEFGFKPATSLDEGLRRTIDFFRE